MRFDPFLIVAWKGTPESNPAPQIVDYYLLGVMKVEPGAQQTTLVDGTVITYDRCTTLGKTRMSKTEGEKLIKEGLKPGSAFFTGRKHRARKL